MTIDRRQLVRIGSTFSLGSVFAGLALRRADAANSAKLVRTGDGVFELPPGFSSVVLDESGGTMNDGYLVPALPDGMACFAGEITGSAGDLVLMRNHEVGRLDFLKSPYRLNKLPDDKAYDKLSGGGVTRVVIDPKSGKVRSRNLVLAGTARNCSGGKSPWGWLTCEESLDDGHGYVFLCDPKAAVVQAPVRIPSYGRFNHEAATVDPATLIAYLTEDRGDGCFYRFVPASPQKPFEGRLEALAIVGKPRLQTGAAGIAVGTSWNIEWVPIKDVDPKGDTLREEAHSKGAALISRGEGLWLDGADVYFSATSGGLKSRGQIFRLRAAASPGARLELVADGGTSDLDMPDNITVAPWGDLFVAEDGAGGNSLRLVKPTGEVRTFANCVRSSSELAGVCFDPAGERLFVNVQSEGLTMMVTGPFRQWADAKSQQSP